MTPIKHVLFPFDFSAQGLQVLPFVRAIASRFGASITLFSAMPPTFDTIPAGFSRVGETSQEWIHSLKERLDGALVQELAGLKVERVAMSGDPAFRITEFAHDHAIDLIMMPTHGLGLFRSLLVGSVTAKVLHDAQCPVWTAAHTETQTSREAPATVVCALDGTPKTPALLKWASEFSAQLGANLKLLHVVTSISDWPSLKSEQALQNQLRDDARASIEAMLRAASVTAPLHVAVGEIADTVAQEARRESADLVIIGRGMLTSALGRIRTHAYAIIQRSPCPVLSV